MAFFSKCHWNPLSSSENMKISVFDFNYFRHFLIFFWYFIVKKRLTTLNIWCQQFLSFKSLQISFLAIVFTNIGLVAFENWRMEKEWVTLAPCPSRYNIMKTSSLIKVNLKFISNLCTHFMLILHYFYYIFEHS